MIQHTGVQFSISLKISDNRKNTSIRLVMSQWILLTCTIILSDDLF